MSVTKIEYLDYTFNPIKMRCTPVSSGCTNCWHLAMAKRLANNPNIPQKHRDAYSGGPLVLDQKELEAPFHLKKASRIGVQFMGDLFHEAIPDEFLIRCFNAMRMAPQHRYFLLTKRPSRMADFCQRLRFDGKGEGKTYLAESPDNSGYCLMGGHGCTGMDWVWLGVSVEDQKTADERIPILLQIPTAHRWVSVEPMLGSVKLSQDWVDYLEGWDTEAEHGRHDEHGNCLDCPVPVQVQTEKLDWVICGGETSSDARPVHPDWVRSLLGQCQAAGVPFFFKGWGEWFPVGEKLAGEFKPIGKGDALKRLHLWPDRELSMRTGRKAAGRLLDGKIWDETPCSKDFP